MSDFGKDHSIRKYQSINDNNDTRLHPSDLASAPSKAAPKCVTHCLTHLRRFGYGPSTKPFVFCLALDRCSVLQQSHGIV